jgi:hypothetical protein
MTRLRRIKPTPSMVIASLALLVALGGTSVAAVAVTSLPRNSVGNIQLKTNAVTSSKVKNGALLRADFKSGQVPAGPQGPAGPPGPTGSTGPAGAAGAAGVASPGYVAQVITANSTSSSSTSSTSFTDLNNASVNVTVPTGETDGLIVFFSGQSNCSGGTATQNCVVRVTVDGNELSPAGGNDAVFDSNALRGTFNANVSGGHGADNDVGGNCPDATPGPADPCFAAVDFIKGSQAQQSNAIVRIAGSSLAAGAHVVKVQFETSDTGTTFKLVNWALVAQRTKLS